MKHQVLSADYKILLSFTSVEMEACSRLIQKADAKRKKKDENINFFTLNKTVSFILHDNNLLRLNRNIFSRNLVFCSLIS